MTAPTSQDLLARYQNGDPQAAGEMFDRYVARLLALVRVRLSPKLGRRVDAEDVVQSAYRSFFVHAQGGEFVLQRAGDLWRLLAAIALNKLHGQVEWHTAKRRDIKAEEALAASSDFPLAEVADRQPSPLEAAELEEVVQGVMQGLSKAQRAVLQMRLSGHTVEEIADELACSQRTVRRTLQQLRQMFQQRLGIESNAG